MDDYVKLDIPAKAEFVSLGRLALVRAAALSRRLLRRRRGRPQAGAHRGVLQLRAARLRPSTTARCTSSSRCTATASPCSSRTRAAGSTRTTTTARSASNLGDFQLAEGGMGISHHPRRRRRLRPAQAGRGRHRRSCSPSAATSSTRRRRRGRHRRAGLAPPPRLWNNSFTRTCHVARRRRVTNSEGRRSPMLDALRQRTVAKVLFDEHHGEAWSIRPEAAARMRPVAPRRLVLRRRGRRAHRAGLRGRHDRRPSARRGGARRRRRARDRPPERRQVGAHGGRGLAALLALPRSRAVAGVRAPAAAASSSSARKRRTSTAATSTSCWRRSASASRTPSSSTTTPATACRPGSSARRRPAGGPGHSCTASDEVRFYRAGTLAADDPGAVVLRTRDGRRPAPGRAARGGAVQGRPRRGRRRLGPVRRRLSRAARQPPALAEPRATGSALAAFRSDSTPIVSEAAQDPAWLRLKSATDALRLLQEPNGEVDLGASRRRRGAGARRSRWPRPSPTWRRRFPHEEDYLAQVRRRPAGLGRGRLRQARLHGLAGPLPSRAAPPRTASRTSSSSRCTRPTASPDTRFEALITRTPWPEFIDAAGARALSTTPSSCRCSWSTTPRATTASARCSSPRR